MFTYVFFERIELTYFSILTKYFTELAVKLFVISTY